MRPIAKSRHVRAALLLGAVVLANTLLSLRQEDILPDQANLLAEVAKSRQPELYASDAVFDQTGAGAAWRLRPPAWRALLAAAVWAGRGEVAGLRIVVALSLAVYLAGMYLLVFRQTGSWSTAVVTAAVSMAVFSLRRPHWGVGPLQTAGPETLYLACVPLLALGWLAWRQTPRLALVAAGAGLLGNFCFSSAVNFILVMLLALVVLQRGRREAWRQCGLATLAALAGLAPALAYYLAQYAAAGWPVFGADYATAARALDEARLNVLYPDVLVEGLRWLPVPATLGLLAGVMLYRSGRYRSRDLGAHLVLLGATAAVALVLAALVQLVALAAGVIPPMVELARALPLAMLPLYVLLGQAMINLLRLARSHRWLARFAITLFAAAWLGSSWNASPLRHAVQAAVRAASGDAAEPDGEAELRAVCRWAAAHAPTDALFLTPHAELRSFGRRSLAYCPADLRYLYHFRPERLGDWARGLAEQRRLLDPPEGSPADAGKLAALAQEYWRRRPHGPGPTYVLVPADAAPPTGEHLAEVPPDGWGRQWRLYAVRQLLNGNTRDTEAQRRGEER